MDSTAIKDMAPIMNKARAYSQSKKNGTTKEQAVKKRVTLRRVR